MSYKVTKPLVVLPHKDGVSSDGYFYKGQVVPDGFNEDRCKQLIKDGFLEVVKAPKAEAAAKSDG